MDKLIENYDFELAEPACRVGGSRFGALVRMPNDISAVFPYLNAVVGRARYDHANRTLIWDEPNQMYAFRPYEIRIAEVQDLQGTRKIVEGLVDRLNNIWQERDTITPNLTERKPPPVIGIFKLLPGTNCKQCGYPTCMAFAAALSQSAAKLEQCPPLLLAECAESREKLSELLSSD